MNINILKTLFFLLIYTEAFLCISHLKSVKLWKKEVYSGLTCIKTVISDGLQNNNFNVFKKISLAEDVSR